MNERFTRAPHHNDRSSAPSPNAALLIDFDNVTMGIRSNLGQELRQLLNSDIIRGKVSVQRAYADWRRYPQYVVPLSEAAIDLIYAPAYGSSKKNATDIRLAIDALELVFTRPEIGSFILLSGDSDFSSLVLKLKEYGKYVIGVGMQESSSDLLVQNCDEYYSYDSLSGLVSADDMDTDRHDPWELCEHSIKKMVERDDVMRSDRLKQVMLELDPSFDEKEIGYSKFNRFLTEASSRGLLKLEKIGNGQYKVGPGSSVDVEAPSGDRSGGEASREADGGPPPPRDLSDEEPSDGRPERDRSEADRGGSGASRGDSGKKERRGGKRSGGRGGADRPVVEAEQLRSAYDLLRDVVGDLSAGEGRVRDSEVKREMLNRDSSFDEGALGFGKFSRFIRQAHDEEVVDVAKDSDGNYYLRPPGGAEPSDGGGRASDADEGGRSSGGEPDRERDERGRGERPEPESREREPAASADGSGEQPSGDAGTAEAPEEADRRGETPTEEPAGSADGGDEEPARRGGGLRRRRKSSGSGGGSDSGDDSWVPGPVDAGGGETSSGPGGSGTSSTRSPTGSAGDSGGRRGLGRFRRGRKSGKGGEKEESESGPTPGPVATEADAGSAGGPSDGAGSPPDGEGAEAEPATTDPDAAPAGTRERPSPGGTDRGASDADGAGAGPSGGEEEIVAHMKDHYSGVGEKTARKLVEEFGGETMEVIDRSPERVENLLPKHRAEAVLQARAVERDRGEG